MSYKINYWNAILLSQLKTFRLEQNFYIFSDPRGGSTWLTELIHSIPSTAILWEPLHLQYAKNFKRLEFGWRQYIPEGKEWSEARDEFEKVIKGKDWSIFSAQMATPLKLWMAKCLIVKICRGNRLLPWFTNQFDLKFKPIFMTRHPFAVVLSQLKQGGWEAELNSFQLPDSPHIDFEILHLPFLQTLGSKEELLTANWCISNIQTLENPRNDKDWIFITYEELFLMPKETIAKIFNEWNLDAPENLSFSKPSATSIDIDTKNKMYQLSKWKAHFKPEQIERMLRVIEYFKIKKYSDAILPEICL